MLDNLRSLLGILEDEGYNRLSLDEAFERICANAEVVCKPTLETGSGRSIQFWNTTADIGKIKAFLTDKSEKDWIVQKVIKQHAELNRVHATSINSLRIVSILMPEDVYILSSNLRMGSGGGRIDNVTAGGISAGVNADGTLKNMLLLTTLANELNSIRKVWFSMVSLCLDIIRRLT